MKYIESIFTLLFPQVCITCKKEGPSSCAYCLIDNIDPLTSSIPTNSFFSQITTLAPYADPFWRASIDAIKFHGEKELLTTLAPLLAKELASVIPEQSVFIPIPLHPRRLRERGFNQSLLLAEGIAAELALPVLDSLLIRTQYRKPQSSIHQSARQTNIRGVFSLSTEKETLDGLDILLVDDVITTGATLYEAAKTLSVLSPHSIQATAITRSF